MAYLGERPKHPSDITAFPIDVNGLGSNTLGAVSGTATPAGLTFSSVTASGSRVTALVSGGTAGVTYAAEVTINISNGERRIAEFNIICQDR